MAQAVIPFWLQAVVTVLLTGMTGLPAAAETLPDPTRPPAALLQPDEQGATLAPTVPVLQSIVIGPGRAVATVNGQALQRGDVFAGSRVVKITESEVVLRNGKDLQVLKLFPDVEKHRTPRNRTVTTTEASGK